MFLTRYRTASGVPALGLEDARGVLRALGGLDLHDVLAEGAASVAARVADPGPLVTDAVGWLPPASGRMEVWACGVTYNRSREARMEESEVADVYERVYHAERPELFFKSVAWRTVTDGEPIGIREDSALNVPEPEVAVVADHAGRIVGYTICNDVSSRTIEGENPLYLPQAKMYAGACSLHRRIRLAASLPEPRDLTITCTVRRANTTVWQASTSTSEMHRTFEDLVSWAFRADTHPHGMVLSTGTGIVPEMDVTLAAGDVVLIDVPGLGTLSNVVRVGAATFPQVLARS
jgi:2-dehydro-3-deoxy-D-arabinonate dehydratase